MSKENLPANLSPGKFFGRYKIMEKLGQGGMGVVYKAYDTQLSRDVAIKLLIPKISAEDSLARLLREAKTMAKLNHPYIVNVHDIGQEGNQYFFVMEYLPGNSLTALIKKGLTSRQISNIMIKIGEAVQYAHEQGVIHRDLKPDNIIVSSKQEPKVMDFGLAKISETSKKISQTGMMIGTLQYMPPEQAQGLIHEIDARSDVYALGAVLYQSLTKCLPFKGRSTFSILQQIINDDPTQPSQIKPRINKNLENICLKALHKKKSERYQSVIEFVEDISKANQGKTVTAKPASFISRIRKVLYHHYYAFWGGILCLLLIVIVIAYDARQPPTNKPPQLKAGQTDNLEPSQLPKILYERSQVYFKQKKYDLALKDLNLAIAKNAKLAKAYYSRALIYRNGKKMQQALDDFSKAIEFGYDKKSEAYYQRGKVYMTIDKEQQAQQDFTACIKSKNPIADAYYYRGKIHHKNKRIKKAFRDFSSAIDNRCTQQADAYHTQAKILQTQGDYQQSVNHLNQAIVLNKKLSGAYYLRGSTCFYFLRNPQQALEDFTQVIQLNPKHSHSYCNRSRVHLAYTNNLEQAKRDIDQALLLDYQSLEARATLVYYYKLILNHKKAKEETAKIYRDLSINAQRLNPLVNNLARMRQAYWRPK